jgi:hypothetical protein
VTNMMLWQGTAARVLAAAIVVVVTPVVAYLYGNAMRSVLKLIRME